jgi:hypothetical protein
MASPRARYHCYAPGVRRIASLLLIVTLCGCQDDGECREPPPDPEFVTLIDHAAWEATPAQDDPLVDHRPATVVCPIDGWIVEENGGLEINTNSCNYVALRQSSVRAISACSMLRIEFYHFDLLAPEPALAHAAMLIDGQVVWEKEFMIPGGSTAFKAMVYEEEFPSPIAAPAGAEVMLHLHNHGQNTYTLLDFMVSG